MKSSRHINMPDKKIQDLKYKNNPDSSPCLSVRFHFLSLFLMENVKILICRMIIICRSLSDTVSF